MKHMHMQLLLGAALWPILGLPLASGAPVTLSDNPQPSAVTVTRQGRLLVLTYNPKSADSLRSANAGPLSEAPQVVVYKGQRQIASGRFAYG